MKKLVGLLCVAVVEACSADKSPNTTADINTITFNDFESNRGWNVDPGLLDKGRAHSGQYALKVDKDHEFSLTFDMALGQVSAGKFKTVHLDAWVFLPSEKSTGVLGIQVMDASNNQQVFGDGLRLGEVVKSYNQWVQVSKDFALPDNVTQLQHMRFSMWRADASDFVLADDVKLTIKN